MDNIHRNFSLIRKLTCNDSVISINNYGNDILMAITASFEEYVKKNADLYNLCFDAPEFTPSTSHYNNEANDPRIRYGYFLGVVYEQLAHDLTLRRDMVEDEFTILSLKEVTEVSTSMQFFILAHILPYLEEGVGTPIHKRSVLIKSWKRLTSDIFYQKEQLKKGLSIVTSLMESNLSLKSEIVKRYLSDIISCSAQLTNLCLPATDSLMVYIEELLNSIPQPLVISTLLNLSKTTDASHATLPWFLLLIGQKLSSILCGTDGLSNTFIAYSDMGGEQFWDDSNFLSRLGRQLAIPPRANSKNAMCYFENICKQFETILKADIHPKRSVTYLFSIFIDEMSKRSPLATSVFILDPMFKPWEQLMESEIDQCTMDDKFIRSFTLLKLWTSDDRICPHSISDSVRLAEIIPTFLGLLTSTESSETCVVQDMIGTAIDVLKFALNKVQNQHMLLYSFIIGSEQKCFQFSTKRKLIVVVGEEEQDVNAALVLKRYADEEEALMSRMESLLKYVKALSKSMSTKLLLEILSESVSRWSITVDAIVDVPRFVNIPSLQADHEWARLSSHLIATICFEQLGDSDFDFQDETISETMCALAKTVLISVSEWVENEAAFTSQLDVTTSKPASAEERMDDVKIASARMAVGLAGAVIAAGTASENMGHLLLEMSAALRRFSEVASDKIELSDAIEQAKQVLQLLDVLGVSTSGSATLPDLRKPKGSSRLPTDYVSDLERDLSDPLEPIRGEALIRCARAIRRKDSRVIAVLDDWLYHRIKDLLADSDSYVYLAAINAVSEVACYDSKKYLSDLLDLFGSLVEVDGTKGESVTTEEETVDESRLILRGKLAEAIGKVFKCLGDIAPAWLERAASVFLRCLRENSDITRACCLSAFSDLIMACRGRGIEKYMDEILYAVDQLIRSDKNPIVRRACVHLIRQCLRSCDSAIFEVIGGRLRDLRRSLTWLWKWDADHVVRLQAELCLEDLRESMKSAIDCETSNMMRIIKI